MREQKLALMPWAESPPFTEQYRERVFWAPKSRKTWSADELKSIQIVDYQADS